MYFHLEYHISSFRVIKKIAGKRQDDADFLQIMDFMEWWVPFCICSLKTGFGDRRFRKTSAFVHRVVCRQKVQVYLILRFLGKVGYFRGPALEHAPFHPFPLSGCLGILAAFSFAALTPWAPREHFSFCLTDTHRSPPSLIYCAIFSR